MKNGKAIRQLMLCNPRFIVDGQPYECARQVFNIAKEKGFTGSVGAIAYRLRNGASTWSELIAKPDRPSQKSAFAGAEKRKRERDECAKIMAEMDARKKAMGL